MTTNKTEETISVVKGVNEKGDTLYLQYAIVGRESSFRFCQPLYTAYKFPNEKEAKKAAAKLSTNATKGFKDIEVISYLKKEYDAIADSVYQGQLNADLEKLRASVFSPANLTLWSEDEQYVEEFLDEIEVGWWVRVYPARSLTYELARVTEIKPASFIAEGVEYEFVTGQLATGDRRDTSTALPDRDPSDKVIARRLIREVAQRPSAFALSIAERLTIAAVITLDTPGNLQSLAQYLTRY